MVADGGGAVIIASPEVARQINRPKVKIMGHGEAPKHTNNGRVDLTFTGARWSGPRAFAEAGVTPSDIDYAISLDQTSAVTEGMREIVQTLVIAIVLVILVVYLFLQDWRATLIPLLAVPVSRFTLTPVGTSS